MTDEKNFMLNLTPSQQARVKWVCQEVMGQRLDIRESKTQKVTGIIESAKPAYWAGRKMCFEVVLVCGTNQVRKTFYVTTFNSIRETA